MACALALHVTDEALTGFLTYYNPAVEAIRARFPFVPLPTFTFGWWLGGLIAGILVLFALTPLAFRRARWLAALAYPFSILMAGNGAMHLAASGYMRRIMPGAYSAPLLLFASLYLLACVYATRPRGSA